MMTAASASYLASVVFPVWRDPRGPELMMGNSLLSAREILAAHGGNERSRFGGTIPFCRRP
jgi:hypothetical protein